MESLRDYGQALRQGKTTIWKRINWVPGSQLDRNGDTCMRSSRNSQRKTKDGKVNSFLECEKRPDTQRGPYDILDPRTDRYRPRGASGVACGTTCEPHPHFVQAQEVSNALAKYNQNVQFTVLLGGIGLLEFGAAHNISWEDSLKKRTLFGEDFGVPFRAETLDERDRPPLPGRPYRGPGRDRLGIRYTYMPLSDYNSDIADVVLYAIVSGLQMKIKKSLSLERLLKVPGGMIGSRDGAPGHENEGKALNKIMTILKPKRDDKTFSLQALRGIVTHRTTALGDVPNSTLLRDNPDHAYNTAAARTENKRYEDLKDYFKDLRTERIRRVLGFRGAARGPRNLARRRELIERARRQDRAQRATRARDALLAMALRGEEQGNEDSDSDSDEDDIFEFPLRP